ncbi:MAG: porin [Polyangiales bacterium]
MRVRAPLIIAILALGILSAASAQGQDADAPEEQPSGYPKQAAPDDKHPRLVKPKGTREDNMQLGGEPSLTEVIPKAQSKQGAAARPEQDQECDLDCLEAQLASEEQEEQSKKRTLEVGKETGAIAPAVQTSEGDTLAAEPSTTTLAKAAARPEARKLPARLGPVRIRVGKTEDWIGIGFASQLEFQYDQQLAGGGVDKSNTETLQFRRIRLIISSSFIEGRIQSRFQINLTPSSFELIDMWFSFTRFKYATLRIGQFKIPYDRYRAQSFAALSFIDWAPTTRMFGSERQVGAEFLALGGFLGLEYSAGIFTGTNARASFAVGLTEVYGDTPTNPSNLGSGEVFSTFHPALVGRVAKNFGEIDTDTNSDVLGTKQLRQSLGVGIAWDARPTPIEDLPLRLSLEWLAKISHADINVITYLAWYSPWDGGKMLFGPMGFMAEAGYRFTSIWELAIRYSITYLTPWLRSDARSYGEFQIMNATDPESAMMQYEQNGNQVTNDQLALAGTAHIIGNSLKVIAEFAWVSQLWAQGRRNGVGLGFQIQLLF